jgi:hypothetical protein
MRRRRDHQKQEREGDPLEPKYGSAIVSSSGKSIKFFET